MRVLWIANQPIGAAVGKLKVSAVSGTWMDPTLAELAPMKEVTIGVAFVADVAEPQSFCEGGVIYYAVPRDHQRIYRYTNSTHQNEWKCILDSFAPDLIMVWGTEYAHGLCAMLQARDIPCIIVIQGILESVARYYLGDMEYLDIRRNYSFRNFIKHDSVLQEQLLYRKKVEYEKLMYQLAGNVILENRWAEAYFKAVVPDGNTYIYKTKIKDLFFEKKWKGKKCKKHSIMCTSPAGSPYKGLHHAISALAIIKNQYPDVELRVPGMASPFGGGLKEKLKRKDYFNWIIRLISENHLENNITFLGSCSSEQISEELEKANVFILPACVENQSMSLREAMAVGTPIVASAVGGIPETITDGVEGYLIRPGEYENLANLVISVFRDEEKAENMSNAARSRIREYYSTRSDSETLLNIYKDKLNIQEQ